MTTKWSALSIRARLAAWYTVVLSLMLVVYAAATFIAVRHEFVEQLDDQLRDDFEAAEARLARTPDGRIAWTGDRHADPDADEDRAQEAWSTAGEPIYRSELATALPPATLTAATIRARYESVTASGERWRMLSRTADIGGRPIVLRVSRSEERLRRQLAEILVVLTLGVPFVVAMASLGGYVLARRALSPIDRLASDAGRITADRLHERLSISNPHDELGRLASVINATFERLESSFDQLRRFTADASHELRTPLAVIRGIGEVGLATSRTPAEYKEAMGSMLEEVDRLTSLVDSLLRLSYGDAGRISLERERIDLGRLTSDVASSLGILAEERGQRLVLTIQEGVVVTGDRLVVREAITNVIDNAIKYGPRESTVDIRVQESPDGAVLEVADEGPGIPAEHRDRVFDRFFRIDEARSRDQGGTGLGLAIAKWAVEIHGGRISVCQRPAEGSVFRIVLPPASDASKVHQEPARLVVGG